MNRAKRVDKNQKEIVEHLRSIGCSVFVSSSIGAGFPDLVVGCDGKNYLIEIKAEHGKLTSDQIKFRDVWQGDYRVVRSIDDLQYLQVSS